MDDDKSGNSVEEVKRRLSSHQPQLLSTNPEWRNRDVISSVLPEGASLFPSSSRTANSYFGSGLPEGSSLHGGGNSQYHVQRPFLPEWESPDRQHYPTDRKKANYYWRLYHKFDPLFGNAIDMYSEMLFGDFELVVKGDSSKEIKDTLEFMVQNINFNDRLRYFVREYLVIGEVVPQLFWSEELGVWTYIGFHNPDDIDIKDAPIINMDPIISFIPDDSLRNMLTDGSPESMELRQKLPSQFVAKVMARQKIRLSPVNCSFIARKLHPYDPRGTSLASRLWRIFMVEDAVYSATIATYRRHASPLKVVKLGDPSVGWIPDPAQESKLLELLAKAEIDSNSWLVWNYGINFEAWGTTDRVINIKSEYDTIEKVKLSALGLSKSFMSGEVSYASAKSGLQVFLRRLLSLRQYFESIWIYPKFFRPVSEMNSWIKAKPSEINHKYRIKKTSRDIIEENRIIMPEVVWKNKLDPKLDQDLINAYKSLETLRIKMSKSTISAAAGLDWEDELESSLKEFKKEKEIKKKILGDTLSKEYNESTEKPGGAKPPGGPGGGTPPPGAKKSPGDNGGEPTPPGGADKGVTLDDNVEGPSDSGMSDTID